MRLPVVDDAFPACAFHISHVSIGFAYIQYYFKVFLVLLLCVVFFVYCSVPYLLLHRLQMSTVFPIYSVVWNKAMSKGHPVIMHRSPVA